MMIRPLLERSHAALKFVARGAERGTASEAQSMVKRAIAFYEENGLEALVERCHTLEETPFRDRDLYIFAYDYELISVINGPNPKMIGRDFSALKDPKGVSFPQDMLAVAKGPGEGWVEYHFADPKTKTLKKKASWIKCLDENVFIGAGIYTD